MPDYRFIQDPATGGWVISAPKRSKRPDQSRGVLPPCPFEPGHEQPAFILNQVRVVPNKYPFAPIHEIIIHSDDHHKNFDELPVHMSEDIFNVYRKRFEEHKDKGQVYIFHNQGKRAGESLPHPHTQLTVVPGEVKLKIPELHFEGREKKELKHLYIFCPGTSEWPDEVWIAPHKNGVSFNGATDAEVNELAFAVGRLLQIFDLRHGHDFPFNFYIHPGKNWYLRFIPRLKTLGGFEIGTGVSVNTQAPFETLEFIKEHFDNPDIEKIKSQHLADYWKSV